MASVQDIATGLNPARPIGSHDMAALMRLLSDKVRTSISQHSVEPLMDFVYSSLSAGSSLVAHVPIACRSGCNFCCHAWVDATPPEVLYAVKSMSPDQRDRALEAVEEARKITAGVEFFDRCGKLTPACPLLDEDGGCSVYQSRPVNCRTLVSSSAQQCKDTFMHGSEDGFPAPIVWHTLRDSYSTALEGALIHVGLAYQARELNESLKVALAVPEVEARWLSGADDFQAAGSSPAPPIFDNPTWRGIYKDAFGVLPF